MAGDELNSDDDSDEESDDEDDDDGPDNFEDAGESDEQDMTLHVRKVHRVQNSIVRKVHRVQNSIKVNQRPYF